MTENKKPTPRRVRKVGVRVAKNAEKAPVTAPVKLKLLITVVNREKVEFYTDLLQSFEVNMQMSFSARGTASSDILQLMGLEESAKSVIFSIIREDKAAEALRALEQRFATIKRGKGIAYTIPLTSVVGVTIYRFLSDNRMPVKEDSK